MKKTLLYLIMAAGLMGCAKEMVPASEENQTGKPMTFEINVLQTKAAKTDWATGDVIYVFFQGISDKYLALTYNGSGWDESCPAGDLLDTDFAGVSDYKLAAVHFPVAVDVSFDEGEFQFSLGGEVVHSYFMSESEKAYTVDGATVTATLSLAKPEKVVLFHIPGIQDNLSDYVFSCELVKSINCTGVSDAIVLEMVSKISGGDLFGCPDADGAIFTALLTSLDAEDYFFTLESPGKTYSLIRKAKALKPGKMYNFPALDDPEWTVEDNPGFINGHAYVDLGNGKKWATCNVGASKPEEYGNYFAWGEIAPKTDYSWATYKWMQECQSEWKYITKYTFADGLTEGIWYDGDTFVGDNKTSLVDDAFADDAARQIWKGSWRIPTDAEWTWLRENCDWAWTADYEGTGIAGQIVTSKVEGYKDNSIFLPAAGFRYGTSLYSAGSVGNYWSSSLREDLSVDARFVYFDSEDVGRKDCYRYYGVSVRPVSE